MFDLFNKQKLQEVRNALKISQSEAEYWENHSKQVEKAILENDAQIKEYLETVYKGKYFKFTLYDAEKDSFNEHRMLINSVNYGGGLIVFKVQEGEKPTEYKTTFGCLHNFKQISKKTYLGL